MRKLVFRQNTNVLYLCCKDSRTLEAKVRLRNVRASERTYSHDCARKLLFDRYIADVIRYSTQTVYKKQCSHILAYLREVSF